jgi:hypothetical protein
MVKNVLLPLVLIVFGGTAFIFLNAYGKPLSYLAVPVLALIGLSCMYITYFTCYRIFPDKRNKHLPAITNIPSFVASQKNNPQEITKGSLLAALFSFLLSGILIYSIITIADIYKN